MTSPLTTIPESADEQAVNSNARIDTPPIPYDDGSGRAFRWFFQTFFCHPPRGRQPRSPGAPRSSRYNRVPRPPLSAASDSRPSEHRVFVVGARDAPDETPFPRNRIISNKYTLWNFAPKNLLEQFRRIGNLYFLVMAMVALSIESPISPLTSLLPLLFVIAVTACKQGYEDYRRYRADRSVNRTPVEVIRDKCTQEIAREEIAVGDLVRVKRDQDVPCDIVILHSSESAGCCYVTTVNLDGETNLKTLFVPRILISWSVERLVGTVQAVVTCQRPLASLVEFHGKIEITNEHGATTTSSLTIDNLLLRGARLRDTEYVVGAAVYTGAETKLSLNSIITRNKFSTAEKSINAYIVFFVAILSLEVTVSTFLKEFIDSRANWDVYLGESGEGLTLTGIFTDILAFTVLYNYIVPISLYVSIEMEKFVGSLLFRWDLEMYDEKNDQPAVANTSDLNEELGQVEHLFTDKTGTLTENLMVFRRCFIDDETYMEKDCDGHLYLLPANGDEGNAVKLESWPTDVWHFMMSLSLCHTVHIAPAAVRSSVAVKRAEYRESFRRHRITRVNSSLMMDPDLPEYQAASADEKALVEASARCGVILTKSTGEEMEVKLTADGTLRFKKLDTLEFSSERKRMSVIVKDSSGDIWLYCKGADSAIFPLTTVARNIDKALEGVSDFSKRGFRTLVMAYKKLSASEYDEYARVAEHARRTIGPERAARVERAYDSIERGLALLGVSAVEDRLQEGVRETLESLRIAGIKTWVLTGDKAETAENIAFSCGHFERGTEMLRLMEQTTVQLCFMALASFERRLSLMETSRERQRWRRRYGLMTDGPSVAIAVKNFPELLRKVSTGCDAVVCCRMSPLQKCEIVRLIKSGKSRPLTAAIGDGGNDVSMIQEAHVGLGIIGKEGRQASMSADFAFSKFMHLRRALLVHGHWYYVRIGILTQYFFYKNVVFVTPQLLFGAHSGFSSQAIYDSIFFMCFNLLFTSLPILCFGSLEQDYPAEALLRFPRLYRLNKKNRLLSGLESAIWMITGIWQASVIYLAAYRYWLVNPVILYNDTPADFWSFSTCLFHLVTLVTNLQIFRRASYRTVPFVASVVLSEVIFFAVAFSYSAVRIEYDGDMLWVFQNLLMSPSFWLLTVIVVTISLLPDILVNVYNGHILPVVTINGMATATAAETTAAEATAEAEVRYPREDGSVNYSENGSSAGSQQQYRRRFNLPRAWRGKFSLDNGT